MDLQETLNNVVAFARKQGAKSADLTGPCYYRHDHASSNPHKGKMCFVGAMIPDNVYNISMENNDFDALLKSHPNLEPYFAIDGLTDQESDQFWEVMQAIHDDHDTKIWEHRFQLYAEYQGLHYGAPR